MTLIVYGAALFSICTQRVLTTREELNVEDYRLEAVDLSKGVHKSPEFLKLQPFGQVPVLQNGDLTIFESHTIVRYLSENFAGQGTPLLGQSVKDKAVVSQWLEVEAQNYNPRWASQHVGVRPAAMPIVFEKVIKSMMGAAADKAVVAKKAARLEKVLDVYEAHLAKSKFLAGESFSLAYLSHRSYNMLVHAAGKAELIMSRQ